MSLLTTALVMAASIQATAQEYTFTTLAGLAGNYGSADGTGRAARFYWPRGVAVDSADNVYVADTFNSTIRKVTPAGMVTTLAGLAGTTMQESWGSADGTGSDARFSIPNSLAVDNAGNLYVADTSNYTIRKVTPGGVVTTLAGLAGSGGSADGTDARFRVPGGVSVDVQGNVYVADTLNHTIRVGRPASPDAPTIDRLTGPVGQARQLDTSPQTAVAWQWRLVRVPAGSATASWTANVRNPTFTPDAAGLFIFQLTATDATGAIAIRTLAFTGVDFNPQLGIAKDATGKVTITWTTGTLVSSPTADGDYAPVANAISPYEVTPPSPGSIFYRVRQ